MIRKVGMDGCVMNILKVAGMISFTHIQNTVTALTITVRSDHNKHLTALLSNTTT